MFIPWRFQLLADVTLHNRMPWRSLCSLNFYVYDYSDTQILNFLIFQNEFIQHSTAATTSWSSPRICYDWKLRNSQISFSCISLSCLSFYILPSSASTSTIIQPNQYLRVHQSCLLFTALYFPQSFTSFSNQLKHHGPTIITPHIHLKSFVSLLSQLTWLNPTLLLFCRWKGAGEKYRHVG